MALCTQARLHAEVRAAKDREEATACGEDEEQRNALKVQQRAKYVDQL